METIVYVLTRTSSRPYFFHENYLSVKSQTYPNIRHLVSYDDYEVFADVGQPQQVPDNTCAALTCDSFFLSFARLD